MAKRWYIPRWNITNDSLLDDGFSCRTLVDRVAPPSFFSTLRNMDYDQLFAEFNVGAARQICLGSEVRSRAEHELELKEKLREGDGVPAEARGLAAGHEHGIAGTLLSAVEAYNPETVKNNYLDAVKALEGVDFPLVRLLKSKKNSGMDEVLDCFLLDGPLANLPEAAYLQPCLEQLSVPIYHAM
ncbi:hypothetical protein Tco_1547975 [Tanacetum coccineum]